MKVNELIQDLRDRAEFLQKVNRDSSIHNSFAETMSQAANAIEELSKPKWIPVTERLPEEYDRYYLVCLNNWNTDFCLYTKEKGFGMYITPKWWDANDEVTHWMPLPSAPEPPKEEEKCI